ncbi:MAG TPA: Ig-like domain-containing protein [Rubrobacter sp.]|nr:Ig-like domain-containing protein [Rubrobacter sp.]
MIRTVFERTRFVGDPRGGLRLPVVRWLILMVLVCFLASLAVAASASAATSFTNTSPITIPSSGNASPYPSEINVGGLTGPITDISVTLHRFGHKFPSEVDILLVSPGGKGVILMSDACSNAGNIEDFTWTFSQSAPGPMSGDCSAFTYRPTNVSDGDFWPQAPAGPYSTSLDAFDNEAANGSWKLFVVDDTGDDGGDIEGGWSLSIDTGPVDLAIPGTGTSGPASFYPATRTVSGQEGLISDLDVTIDGIWHQNPDDLDLLLVGPQGQKVILMSDACGSFGVKAFGWVWSDEAPAPMPDGDGTNVCSARFQRPTDYEPGDAWPTPAPPGPYSTSLSAFDRTDPNGTWQLFVNDDSTGNTGFFTNRFTLGITTDTTPPTVVSVSPANDARGVRRVTNVTATFSEAMKPGSINRNTFELFKAGTSTRIGATVSYDGMGGRALLDPNSNLKPGTRYKAVVTTGAKDLSGNGLDQNPNVTGSQQKSWSFTTKN